MTYRRIAVLTTILCFAAGATALAIEVTPSTSITLQTRTRGMSGDPDAQRVEIAALLQHCAPVEIEDTCALTFSDGTRTATVNVRIVKP